MPNSKILILLLYCERPILVKNALTSILKTNYSNWHLAFIDDSAIKFGEPIVKEVMLDYLDRVSFYVIGDTLENKFSQGSLVGKFMNRAIAESDAELAIILCDDDELHPQYLTNLNEYFNNRPTVSSCYSRVHLYNPAFESSKYVNNLTGPLNRGTDPINARCKVDASQVAWRTSCNKTHNIWFEYPKSTNLDSSFFNKLYENFPPGTFFSGVVSQYKAQHPLQLTLTNKEKEKIWTGELGIDLPDIEKATLPAQIISIAKRYVIQDNAEYAKQICKKGLEVYPRCPIILKFLNSIDHKRVYIYSQKD